MSVGHLQSLVATTLGQILSLSIPHCGRYEHNDVEAGSCTVERDFVMEEVYRMVSTHRLIDETEAVCVSCAKILHQHPINLTQSMMCCVNP